MVSREAAFLYNNLLLVGIAFSVLWGTLVPDPQRVGSRLEDHGGAAVLQHGERAARPAPARADRHRAAHRVAEGVASPICKRQFVAPVLAGVAFGALLCCSACATRTRSCRTSSRLRHGHDRTGVHEGDRRAARDSRRVVCQGVRAARRAQPAPVRRLHRARGHRRALRRVRRPGVQARKTTSASRAGQAFETTDPYGARWRFVSQGVSTSASLNREVTAVALEAFKDGESQGLIKSEKRQYFDSQQAADRSSRQPRSGSSRPRSRTRTSCSRACATRRREIRDHLQSAGRLGVGRRDSSWPSEGSS